MAENFYTILTTAGLAAFANAQVSQENVDFAKIAVGDSKGTYYNPVATATGLVNEVWSGPINSISLDEKNPNWIIVEAVIPATVGGFTVREIGVYNTAGILLAIGKVPETYKPAAEQGSLKDLYLRMILEVSNASAVTLKVDPAVIFASRKYVDEKFGILTSNIEAVASRIGDLNKLETDYKKDVVGAVNEVQQELNTLVESLGFHEPISEVLERGTNEINAPVKTLCSVTGLEGRTIINYAPLFDSGAWAINTNATVTAPNTIVVKATDIYQQTRYNGVPLKVGGTYRLYYDIDGPNNDVYVNIEFLDASGKVITWGKSKTPDQTFTVPPLTNRVDMYVTSETNTGTYTIKNVMLIEAQETKLPFVANMQGITNPTIENIRDNLIPAFNYGGAYHVPGWMYLKVIDHTGASWNNNENARVLVPVVPGTKYTFSCIRKGMVGITGNDGSSADAAQHTNIFTESEEQNSPMNCTFTVPAGVNFIRIVFMTTAGGYVASPMLVKGATPAAYKPQVREALTVKTTLYAGDSLNIDTAGHVVKHAAKKEVMLDGNLDWKLEGGTYTGYKRVQAKIAGTLAENLAANAVKFNGAMLEYFGNSPTKPDQVVLYKGDGNVYLSVANTDSGWGQNYNPTPEEIKAYFMGWTMYDGTLGQAAKPGVHLYNGGNSKWWSARDNSQGGWVEGVNTLPTTQAPINGLWQPYKLVYMLPSTLSEVVATTGSLTLDEGENMLVVSEGLIAHEIVTPYHYKEAGYNRYEINTRIKSPLDYNTTNILQVYKNGNPDNAWTIEYVTTTTLTAHVRALLDANLFDPTAVYTVDYIPIEQYRVSVPTNAITIEYADKLGGVIQLLVTTAAKLGAQASNMQNSPSFRFGYDEGGLYIAGKGDI